MSGGEIKNNNAQNGGGIYATTNEESPITPAVVTLKGGIIEANTATNGSTAGSGGGIYIDESCTLTMQDNAKIKDNTAKMSGGGIYARGATVRMTDCTLTGNTTNEASGGGGVCAEGGTGTTRATIRIEGGTINANKALNSGSGGGIYVNQHASVVLRGAATVTGNTADVQGGGVYVRDSTATFIMSGEATVDTGNDVYLANALITVNDGALTGTAPVARITVTDTKYSNSTTVLTGTITAGTPPNQNYTKFTVTPQDLGGGTTQQWEVGSDGRLKMKP